MLVGATLYVGDPVDVLCLSLGGASRGGGEDVRPGALATPVSLNKNTPTYIPYSRYTVYINGGMR